MNNETEEKVYKIFVSVPMANKSVEQIRQAFDDARNVLVEELGEGKFEIVDTLIEENPPEGVVDFGIWYLAKSIEIMANCDICVFTGLHEYARGCKIEYDVAWFYEKPMAYVNHYTYNPSTQQFDITRFKVIRGNIPAKSLEK